MCFSLCKRRTKLLYIPLLYELFKLVCQSDVRIELEFG